MAGHPIRGPPLSVPSSTPPLRWTGFLPKLLYPNSIEASFEARPNGKPPGPGRWYEAPFHRPGPGGFPSVPPQLER